MYTIISKIRNNIKPLNRLHNVTIYVARSHPVATIWTNYRSDRIEFQPIEISRVTRCAASGYAPLLRPKKISKVTQYTLSNYSDTHNILIKSKAKLSKSVANNSSTCEHIIFWVVDTWIVGTWKFSLERINHLQSFTPRRNEVVIWTLYRISNVIKRFYDVT